MARACEVCGKKAQMGNAVETRGKAKYLGGVGTKITGLTRRKFKPNLQKIKVSLENGTVKTMRVCTQCIRSGRVRKACQAKAIQVANVTFAENRRTHGSFADPFFIGNSLNGNRSVPTPDPSV